MRKNFLFICLSWLIALTANADNLTLYLTKYGLSADANINTSTAPYYKADTSIEEGTVVTIRYTGNDNTTVLSIYINGEVVSSGKISQKKNFPYTFTAKKNCYIRVEGNYAFNFTTNPNVYFTQDIDVTGVTLSQAEAAMTVGGETLTLTATVAPDNATDKTVTWTTSDASVATVTDGVVTAVGAGTATITATATNGTDDTSDNFSATCEVTVAASSGSAVEVAWDKDKKSGSFTMPGGNVTLEPDYYPQAALTAAPTAINDVPATTDGAIVNAGTVANIGETANAQGTVMYYVSPSALDDAALLALAADQWTADVPTAESLAEGQAYVYYYVRGNDSDTDDENFSDGDILAANALTVTIAAEPTYAVTFADGVNPEPPAEPEWTASPAAGVTKGQTVTVTYTGSKKVIGVKAEKKAAVTYPLLSAATTSDYGKVVCAAGHLHDAKTAVPDGCTAVGILGKVTETGHGLILALQDAEQQNWNNINGWDNANYASTTLKVLPDDADRGSLASYTALGETTVSNWAVAQKSDYDAIFTNLGSTTGDGVGKTYDGNVNAFITTGVGGTAISGENWSPTEDGVIGAWSFNSYFWSRSGKSNSYNVRPVLGF